MFLEYMHGLCHLTLKHSYPISFQPVLHNCCNKGRGMCYPVCGFMHIKEPFLLIEKSSPCSGGSGFPLLPSCSLPYDRRHITVNNVSRTS